MKSKERSRIGDMRVWTFAGLVLAAALLGSCTSKPGDSGRNKPVLVINDLKLTPDDLRWEIERVPIEPALPPVQGEPEWLARVVERELIVQEGRRMGLDREPEFMRSIERFWKEALLKQVLQRKAREISSGVQVNPSEVEAYYEQWLKAQRPGTLSESLTAKRPEIERTLRQQKEADAMEEWIVGLRREAKIRVDRQALEELR